MKKHCIKKQVISLATIIAIVLSFNCVAFASEPTNNDFSNNNFLSSSENASTSSLSLLRYYVIFNRVASYHPVWNEGGDNPFLTVNLATESTSVIKDNTNVNLYSNTGHISQKWKFIQDERGEYRVVSMINQRYAWNVYRYGGSYNCDVMPYVGNEVDSEIASHMSSTSANINFQLQNYQAYYLTTVGNTSGANVKWHSGVTPDTWASGYGYTLY